MGLEGSLRNTKPLPETIAMQTEEFMRNLRLRNSSLFFSDSLPSLLERNAHSPSTGWTYYDRVIPQDQTGETTEDDIERTLSTLPPGLETLSVKGAYEIIQETNKFLPPLLIFHLKGYSLFIKPITENIEQQSIYFY